MSRALKKNLKNVVKLFDESAFILDEDNIVTYINENWYLDFNYGDEQVLGKNIEEFISSSTVNIPETLKSLKDMPITLRTVFQERRLGEDPEVLVEEYNAGLIDKEQLETRLELTGPRTTADVVVKLVLVDEYVVGKITKVTSES